RSATRAGGSSAIHALSVSPEAARAATKAFPSNNPASTPAVRSKISAPIATPPRFRPLGGENTPNGRFSSGNSECPFADSTQLRRDESCVSSIEPVIFPYRIALPDFVAQRMGESRFHCKVYMIYIIPWLRG